MPKLHKTTGDRSRDMVRRSHSDPIFHGEHVAVSSCPRFANRTAKFTRSAAIGRRCEKPLAKTGRKPCILHRAFAKRHIRHKNNMGYMVWAPGDLAVDADDVEPQGTLREDERSVRLSRGRAARVSWTPALLQCPAAIVSAVSPYKDRARWADQLWRCLSCGAPIDPCFADTEQPIFKTYHRVLGSIAHAPELERLCGDGMEPTLRTMRGLTIPRPVHVKSIAHMGKEVIAHPADTPEDLTAEQLNATDLPYLSRRPHAARWPVWADPYLRYLHPCAGSQGEPSRCEALREPTSSATRVNDSQDRAALARLALPGA
jgi:hypothetical protein